MFTQIRYSGTVVNRLGKPVSGLGLQLRVYNLEAKQWEPVSEAETIADGVFKGRLSTSDFAEVKHGPQFRLWDVDADAPLGAAGEPSMATRALTVTFGTIVRSERSVIGPGDQLDPAAAEEITRLKTKLLAAEVDLTDARARLTVAEQSRDEAVAQRDDFKLQLEQIRNADTAAPLFTDLVDKISTSLGEADRPTTEGGFRLADARLTLKGYLSDGGNRFKPLDAAEVAAASSAGASEITFSLTAPSSSEAPVQTMPDLLGLTPSTANRVLRPFGVVVQVVESAGTPAGAVVGQTPQAGEELSRGDTVRLQVANGTSEG
jgi:hypothetical protein